MLTVQLFTQALFVLNERQAARCKVSGRSLLGVLLGIWLVIPAQAQLDERLPRPGSRILESIPTYEVEPNEVRVLQARFGECVVKKHPQEARTFVLRYLYHSDDHQAGATKIVKRLADGRCLIEATGGGHSAAMMKLPGGTLGYILAEVLFRLELAGLPPLSNMERIPPLEHPVLDERDFAPPARARKSKLAELTRRRTAEVTRIYLSKFGECIVRTNPSGSYNLLKSDIASSAEDAAFAALAGTLKSCLLDEYTVALTKSVLRGAIAYNYYRLARIS